MNATNGECQVCKKVLGAEDDVVICPECGAPYHRECYQKTGKCVYEARHKSGFEYKNPAAAYAQPTAAAGAEEDAKGAVCSRCGTVNAAENIFCESCGQPLSAAGAPSAFGGMPFGVRTFEDAYYGGAVNLDGEIDGVKKRDWATFIGRSSGDYITKMSFQQQRDSKLSFSPSALLFPTFYFAYRKLWLWTLVSFFAYVLCATPVFLQMLQQSGVPFAMGISPDLLNILANTASVVNIAAHVCYGMFAVYLYRRNALKKIQAIQKNKPEGADYEAALKKAGGVSFLGLAGGFALYFAFGFAMYAVGGDAVIQYLYPSLYQAIMSQSA